MFFKKTVVELSKFKKINDSDDAGARAEKIIYFMENEGGFKSSLTKGKLDESKRKYILENEQGLYDYPPKEFSTSFIMSVKIAREMLSPNNEAFAKAWNYEFK